MPYRRQGRYANPPEPPTAAPPWYVAQVTDMHDGAWSLPITVTTASETLLTTAGQLFGWSLEETTGSASAKVRIFDGDGQVAVITLASGGSATQWFGDRGIRLRTSLKFTVVSGSVQGGVFARPHPWIADGNPRQVDNAAVVNEYVPVAQRMG